MTNQAFDQTKNSSTGEAFAPPSVAQNLTDNNWTKYQWGALIGLPGGILILLFAVFLNVFDIVEGDRPHGIWLFVAAYPLFALGAHCLDKINELKKAIQAKKMNIEP